MPLIRVCSKKDFVNGRFLVNIENKEIAIFEIKGKYHAISNTCLHMGGPLVEGEMDEEGFVACPWHKYRFDPKTGKSPGGSPDAVETYDVTVKGDDIFLLTEPKTERSFEFEEFTPIKWETPSSQKAPDDWKCLICKDEYKGKLPPKNCSKCMAPWELIKLKEEASAFFTEEDLKVPTYNIEEKHTVEYLKKSLENKEFSERRLKFWRSLAEQPPIDVLVISGSAHPQHIVSGFVAPEIIKRVKETNPKLNVEWVDLVKYKIEHNWACYSLADDWCRFPCNNMEDDMVKLYPKIIRAKSIMVCTPINWEGMNSRLKVFLDRLTNIQDIPLKVGGIDCAGKPVGVFVNGHEDGAYKDAWDVFVHFQNMGYVLAPFGIWYNLSSLSTNTNEDLNSIRKNELAISRMHKVIDNVIEFMKLKVNEQLKLQPEGEKLRKVNYVAM